MTDFVSDSSALAGFVQPGQVVSATQASAVVVQVGLVITTYSSYGLMFRNQVKVAGTSGDAAILADDPVLLDPSNRINPSLVDDSDAATIFPPALAPTPILHGQAEQNPYGAHIPAHPEDFTEFYAQQQRTLRAQHNTTQAGDTTFDVSLLVQPTPAKLYTLGSLGRFYHAQYGLIMARYVQFTGMVSSVYPGQPVGRVKKAETVDWLVSNDYGKSGSDLPLGVVFIAGDVAEGYYGWAVTHGANIDAIGVNGSIVANQNDAYSWTGTGEIGLDSAGRIIGRRWGKAGGPAVGPGAIYIELEGMTPHDLMAEIQTVLDGQTGSLSDFSTRLTADEALITGLRSDLSDAGSATAAVLTRLILEEKVRARDIAALGDSIGGGTDWAAAIKAAASAMTLAFQDADNSLAILISAVGRQADRAYALANLFNTANVIPRIDRLELSAARIDEILAAKTQVPLTLGTLPGTILFNSDGAVMMIGV